MYKGKLKAELYQEMVKTIIALPDELKHDPLVSCFKNLVNLTLDFLAPKDNTDKRDFTAISTYLYELHLENSKTSNIANNANATVNILAKFVDEIKTHNTVLQQKVDNLESQIAMLKAAQAAPLDPMVVNNEVTVSSDEDVLSQFRLVLPLDDVAVTEPLEEAAVIDTDVVANEVAEIIKVAKKLRNNNRKDK